MADLTCPNKKVTLLIYSGFYIMVLYYVNEFSSVYLTRLVQKMRQLMPSFSFLDNKERS